MSSLSTPLRLGIVGAGLRGQMFGHAVQGMPGVEIVGACDPSDGPRSGFARAFGTPEFSDHRDLLAAGIDAAIVATPDFAHRTPAVDLASAGVHLLVEKPLATTVADAEDIVQAVRSGGAQGFVGFENRWANTFSALAARSHNGDFGRLRSLSLRLNNSRSVPLRMLSWAERSTPAWFLMPHALDMALWLSGQEVASVTARATRGVLDGLGVHTYDTVHALLTLRDGAIVSLESTWALPDDLPSIVDYKVHLVGEKARATVDHEDQMMRIDLDRHSLPRTLGSHRAGADQGPAPWMARSFVRRLQGLDEDLPTVEHGLVVTRVIAAIHESAEDGSTIAL
ncbi:MAG: Gfo/Idh/MocA family oxidoreductase [Microbacterium sp.]